MNRRYLFRDLMSALFRKFNVILLTTFIVAVLFAVIGIVREYPNVKDPAVMAEAQLQYEQALLQYDISKEAMEREIAGRQQEINRKQEHMDNSLLMTADAGAVPKMEQLSFIDAGYAVVPGMLYQEPDPSQQILTLIKSLAEDDALLGRVEALIGPIDVAYIRELYTIEVLPEAGTYCISVVYPDSAMLRPMMEVVDGYLLETARQAFKDFDVKTIQQNISTFTEESYATLRGEKSKEIADLNLALTDKVNALKQLQLPQASHGAYGLMARQGVLFGMVGAVLAAMFACLIIVIMDMMRDTVLFASELSTCYAKPVLANLETAKKRFNIVAPLINILQEEEVPTAPLNDRMAILHTQLAAMNVGQVALILPSGDFSSEDVAKMTTAEESLPVNPVVYASNVLADAKALQLAMGCPAWLVAVKKSNTRFVQIQHCLEIAKNVDKQVIGFLIM